MTHTTREMIDMKRKKRVVLVLGGIILLLAALREIGVVDVHLHKSMLSASQFSTMGQSNSANEENFSYHMDLKYQEKTIHTFAHSAGKLPPIEIEAILEEPVYSGNSALPLFKNFKMTYECNYSTIKTSSGHTVQGEIEGEVVAKIYGFCSRRKAKELAFEKAKEQIADYLQDL